MFKVDKREREKVQKCSGSVEKYFFQPRSHYPVSAVRGSCGWSAIFA